MSRSSIVVMLVVALVVVLGLSLVNGAVAEQEAMAALFRAKRDYGGFSGGYGGGYGYGGFPAFGGGFGYGAPYGGGGGGYRYGYGK